MATDPDKSEWGKMSAGQGYGPLATDVGRALFGYRWGEHVGPLLFYVIERSWRWGETRTREADGSWPDAEPCPVAPSELARLWDVPRQRVHESLRWLIAARVLVEVEGGFMVNKNAHQWVDPKAGGLLMRPAMLTYAATARERKHVNRKHKSVTPERDDVSRASVTGCHAPALQTVTPERDDVSRASVTAPIEERAEEHPTGLQRQETTSSSTGTTTDSAPRSSPSRPIRNDPAEVDRVASWAEGIPGPNGTKSMEELGSKVKEFSTSYPIDWIEAAILRGVAAAKPGGIWRYAHKCLLNWHAASGPPDLEAEELAARASRAPKPSPSSKPLPAPVDPKFYKHLLNGNEERHA